MRKGIRDIRRRIADGYYPVSIITDCQIVDLTVSAAAGHPAALDDGRIAMLVINPRNYEDFTDLIFINALSKKYESQKQLTKLPM